MNMIDITPIVNAVIALLAAGVSVFLIPSIKSKTTDEQRKELLEWVKIGVAAAEQLYEGQGRGEEKKKYVLEFLASMGFTVDEEAINAAIEAAVNQLNGGNLPLDNQQRAGQHGPPLFCKKEEHIMTNTKDIDGIALKPGEELTEETLDELSNGKGDDDHE